MARSLCKRWPARLAMLTVALPALACAQVEGGAAASPLRVSGFGTLGLVHVDAPDGWGYRREMTEAADSGRWRHDVDSRLGLQLNYAWSPQLEGVVQVLARKRGQHASDQDAVEWAYLSYRPTPDWSLRLGRVNLDAFLMADYRNVGYGYLTARPPVDLYAPLPTALDGGDVARSWMQGDAQWRAKVAVGSSHFGDSDLQRPGWLRRVVTAMVSREEGGWLLRAGAARTTLHTDTTDSQPAIDALTQLAAIPIPSIADGARDLRQRLGASPLRGTFLELGLRYEQGDWQYSAEWVRTIAMPLSRRTSAYATAGRRVGDWTPYVGYGQSRDELPLLATPSWAPVLTPIVGPAAAAGAQGLAQAVVNGMNASRVVQSTWTLGARWDLHPQAALKLQWDQVRTGAQGSGLWSGAPAGAPATTSRVASAVLDFIF
ncbi:hypothetical protein [Roseateles sp. BYS87W]|uniref:Porin n=1 Tax=Pelomonas baiyunensis TaxID=3299026 RepID=A0ABW7GXL2_9BURK